MSKKSLASESSASAVSGGEIRRSREADPSDAPTRNQPEGEVPEQISGEATPPAPLADEQVARLLQRMNALPEPTMRLNALVETLQSADDDLSVTLLAGLLGRAARHPSRDHRGALSMIPGSELTRRVGYERVKALYKIARQRGRDEVCHLFLSGSQRPLDEDLLLQPPKGETLTLGERKALARRLPRQQIERLLRDPDPDVVENLLRNPAITEREVLKVASRRPIHPEVLLRVFGNSKWANRYRVRKALVYNPYTPIEVALTLTTFLLASDLTDLSRDPGTHAWIRDRAKVVLAERRGDPRGPEPEASARRGDQVLRSEPVEEDPESS